VARTFATPGLEAARWSATGLPAVAAITAVTAVFTGAAIVAAARIKISGLRSARFALRRSIFRWWQVAPGTGIAWSLRPAATSTTGRCATSGTAPAAAPAPASATSAVAAAIPGVLSAIVAAPKILTSAITARAWIVLRWVIAWGKILRSGSVRFRLAFVGFPVRFVVRLRFVRLAGRHGLRVIFQFRLVRARDVLFLDGWFDILRGFLFAATRLIV